MYSNKKIYVRNGRMTLKIKPVTWRSSLTSFPNRKEGDDWERHLRKKNISEKQIMKKIYSTTNKQNLGGERHWIHFCFRQKLMSNLCLIQKV